MSNSYAPMLSLLLALLIPISLGATSGVAPPSMGGFCLPLVSNHHDLNYTADGFFSYDMQQRLPPAPAGATNLTTIRPPMIPLVWPSYAVQVGVGSGHGLHFYMLTLDMAGSLTWMQCEPCVPDLPQESPIFNPDESPSYANVKANDEYCKPPFSPAGTDRCSFVVPFQGASAHGYLGDDQFAFASSSSGGVETIRDIVLGCAHTTEGFQNQGRLAGVLSMNRHPASLARQLTRRGVWRFSYCLFGHGVNGRRGFLRFGDDVPDQGAAQRTAIIYASSARIRAHLVRVVGVSLDGRRLGDITPNMFKPDENGNGGCAIDAGAPTTRVIRAAYDVLEREVEAHLARNGARRTPVPGHGLCIYYSRAISARLPSVALEFFEGSRFTMEPQLLFLGVANGGAQYLCFNVEPDERSTVVGAMQQVDTRFTFDLKSNYIFFAPEQCQRDTAGAS